MTVRRPTGPGSVTLVTWSHCG